MDNLVNRLSQQSDPQKLHSVVHELFSLQKVVRDLSFATHTNPSTSPSMAHSHKLSSHDDKDGKDSASSKSGLFSNSISMSPSLNEKNYSLSKYQRKTKMT